MSKLFKGRPILFALLIVGMITAILPGLAYSALEVEKPLPAPIPPEPYPGTDIYPAEIYISQPNDLEALYHLDIDMEGIRPADGSPSTTSDGFEPFYVTVYIDQPTAEVLAQAGLNPVAIPNEGYRSFLAYGPGSEAINVWPTFAQFAARMQELENTYPEIVDLTIIGQSVQSRPLYCLEITDHPGTDENEPEFKYTANHHGDETTGIEMTMRLAEMLASSYGIDPDLTQLVNEMEIWICPIYNPDGYVIGNRYNWNGEDLNRDFPDRITDPVDDPTGREPETQAFMYFGYDHRFSMGANYHGGAQVLNYPWDAVKIGDPLYAPDDQLFWDFGYGYTSRNSYLWNGGWDYGMTRGWEWYEISGGMQDWAYYWRGEHHVTLEISNTKMPPFEQMDNYWEENRDAMLWWMQRAQTGLSGLVLDARDGTPLDATVSLTGWSVPPLNTILTDPDAGDYHRVIGAGTYTLNASSTGYQSQMTIAEVISGSLTTTDFYLCPVVPYTVSGIITDASTGQPLEALVEFMDSPQSASSDPISGEYSVGICPSAYTMRVSSPGYASEERAVIIDQSQVQDFALIPESTLSPSDKTASSNQVLPSDVVQYQVLARSTAGSIPVQITDTLPVSMTWTGYLTATQGLPIYDGEHILWQGEVTASLPVTITYELSANLCLPGGTTLLNIAEFNGGPAGNFTRQVEIEVLNSPPSLPASPSPADGSVGQPLTSILSWAASSDLNCDDVIYNLYFGTSPDPGLVQTGLTQPYADPGPLEPGTTYYWYVVAQDVLAEITSPTWSFTTAVESLYIPLLFGR